jgi:hypothetical protein
MSALALRTHNNDVDQSSSSTQPGFDSDLRLALERRRNHMVTGSSATPPPTPPSKPAVTRAAPPAPTQQRTGLSLKESVQQTVRPPVKTQNGSHHAGSSPPPPAPSTVVAANGTLPSKNNKDSGYTSSRASLEPSECGDDYNMTTLTLTGVEEEDELAGDLPESPSFPAPPPPEYLNAHLNGASTNNKNRVSMLSAHIDDCFGDRPPPPLPNKPGTAATSTVQRTARITNRENDAMSIASSMSTLSGCSSADTTPARPAPPHRPPTAADSGHGGDDENGSDTETEKRRETRMCPRAHAKRIPVFTGEPRSHNNEYVTRKLLDWRVGDVCDFLCHNQMADYVDVFVQNHINGDKLAILCSNRQAMTKMGMQ